MFLMRLIYLIQSNERKYVGLQGGHRSWVHPRQLIQFL
jgi:hypothetical protein